MKVIIQIPCYNEAETCRYGRGAAAHVSVSTSSSTGDRDGSRDATADVARAAGVHHVVRHHGNRGLAAAFRTGLDACVGRGADIIVNTDADNQYFADDIALLVEPIVAGRAALVVGDRGVGTLAHFRWYKRLLQRLGSWVIGQASGLRTPDATSGFRAMNRETALRTLVLSNYSYTLETLIQAGTRRIPVEFVPIRVHPNTRPSRLMRGIHRTSAARAPPSCAPMSRTARCACSRCSGGCLSPRHVAGDPFSLVLPQGEPDRHVRPLLLAAILIIVGFQVMLIGLVADVNNANRLIAEETLYRLRRMDIPPAGPRNDPDDGGTAAR